MPVGDAGPPPLRPFGLVLHRDGRWSHQGEPVLHIRLRTAFDRGVRYLPEEGVYVVQLGRFRGQIEVEEAAFFVRAFDAEGAIVHLSDGTRERLDPSTLRKSEHDDGLLCDVKGDLVTSGLPARFTFAAQADLLTAVEAEDGPPALRVGGRLVLLPDL
jgi:hypothetical protein